MSKLYEIVSILILLGLGVWYLYPPTAQDIYNKYYRLWKSHDIKRYAYTEVEMYSMGVPRRVRVVVFNNKVINDEAIHLGCGTIDDRFSSIFKDELSFRTVYNSTFGYPEYVLSLFNRVTNFRVLSEEPLSKDNPVCAKYINIINPWGNTFNPFVEKLYNKTYKNRNMMDIEGAYFLYEGKCKEVI